MIKGRLLTDPGFHTIEEGIINNPKKYDWKEFYPDAEEEIPPLGTVPVPKGEPEKITVYMDAAYYATGSGHKIGTIS